VLRATLKRPIVPVFWLAGDEPRFLGGKRGSLGSVPIGNLETVSLAPARTRRGPTHPDVQATSRRWITAPARARPPACPPSEYRDSTLEWIPAKRSAGPGRSERLRGRPSRSWWRRFRHLLRQYAKSQRPSVPLLHFLLRRACSSAQLDESSIRILETLGTKEKEKTALGPSGCEYRRRPPLSSCFEPTGQGTASAANGRRNSFHPAEQVTLPLWRPGADRREEPGPASFSPTSLLRPVVRECALPTGSYPK